MAETPHPLAALVAVAAHETAPYTSAEAQFANRQQALLELAKAYRYIQSGNLTQARESYLNFASLTLFLDGPRDPNSSQRYLLNQSELERLSPLASFIETHIFPTIPPSWYHNL